MSVRLLTDSEVQDYLDGNLDLARQMEIERLIERSPENRALMESYKSLFGRLIEPEMFGSKPNPKTVPLDQLVVTHHRRAVYSVLTGIALGLMGLAAAFALFYLVDFSALKTSLASVNLLGNSLDINGFFERLMAPVWELGTLQSRHLLFLMGVATILLIFKWCDMVLVESRLRRLVRTESPRSH